jgi:hypothetical protein
MHLLYSIGVSVCLLGFGVVAFAFWLRKRKRARRTVGVVQRFEDGRGSKGGVIYRAVVYFEVDGQPFEVIDGIGTSWKPYSIGQQVPVWFEPGQPEGAQIDRWWLPVIYVLVALAGGIFLFFTVRNL